MEAGYWNLVFLVTPVQEQKYIQNNLMLQFLTGIQIPSEEGTVPLCVTSALKLKTEWNGFPTPFCEWTLEAQVF